MKRIPGPSKRPLIANLGLLNPDKPSQDLMRLARRYGEIFQLKVPSQPRFVVISSRRLTDEICDETRFEKHNHSALQELRCFTGDGLFTAYTEERNWGKAHRVLTPAFAPIALSNMYGGMMDLASQLMLKWERMGPEHSVNVAEDFTRLTLDTIALCSFSYRFNSFYSQNMHPFVEAMVGAMQESGRRSGRLQVSNKLMVKHNMQYHKDIRVLEEVAENVIEQRRANPSVPGSEDILDTMLYAKDSVTGETLSDENVRYQMITFLIAGHETTSGLLSFAVYELLRNPHVLAKARAHVDAVLGGRDPDHADLTRLTYIDQVLRETLRLWPTAPAFAVHPFEPTMIGGEYEVLPDDAVLVFTPSMHRDPTVWERPEEFQPERFEFDKVQQLPSNAWKPFGNGQRSCIGRGFALQEAQLVLSMLLARFDMQLVDPSYRLVINETLTIKPENLQVRFTPRVDRLAPPTTATTPAPVVHPTSDHSGRAHAAPELLPVRHGTPVRVWYGSNAGTGKEYARQIAARATRLGYTPETKSLDEAVDAMSADGLNVIVTASYEGQPPNNARTFVDWVSGLPAGHLDGARFAVFGCGNTDWARTYQRVPTLVDAELARVGATRVTPRGVGNARGDLAGSFAEWHDNLWAAAGETFGLEPTSSTVDGEPVTVEVSGSSRGSLLGEPDVAYGTVVENRELVTMTSPHAASKRHLEISLPEGQNYRTGDYLAVLPRNPAPAVSRVLARFDVAHDATLKFGRNVELAHLPVDTPVTAGDLFAGYVELAAPATRRQVSRLAAATQCPPEQETLRQLASDPEYAEQIVAKRLSVLDLLEQYPSINLPLADFVAMLPPLRSRQYSISSSPLRDPKVAALTVAHVHSPAWSGNGTYEGVASTYLAQARPGTRIPVVVQQSPVAFAPPIDLTTPMIMVCAGSGIAPFRGFMQDRALRAAQDGVTLGPALLFFGCRDAATDKLYADELAAWQRDGVVDVRTTYSRAPEHGPEGPLRYVQDRVWADRADVVKLWCEGATVFVCGDGEKMAPAVRETMERIYANHAEVTLGDAQKWLTEMEHEQQRYVTDIFE